MMRRSPVRSAALSLPVLLLGLLAAPALCEGTEILIYGPTSPAPTWPTGGQWEARSRFNDGIDGGDEIDLVGGSGATYAGLYVYDDDNYLYFRIRVNYAGAFGGTTEDDTPWWGNDTVWVMIDGNRDYVVDYALAWDAKSKDNTKHGLEFQIRNDAGATWGTTRFYDIDMDAAKKTVSGTCAGNASCYHYDVDQSGQGYVRVTDQQEVCDSPWTACSTMSDTAYIDIAVKWDYILSATTVPAFGALGLPALTKANADSWNLQLGTKSGANDHVWVDSDIAAGFSPASTGEGGNPPYGGTLGGDAPTLVELGAFYALAGDGVVAVYWDTLSEADTAGFHLWRKGLEEEEYGRLTETLVPAEGSPTQGASYRFEDAGV